MKGVIALCTAQLIIEKYGKEKWEVILDKAGLPKDIKILPFSDVADSAILNVVKAACSELNVSLKDIADLFGDYWVNVYSQKMYKLYYSVAKSAKDFILRMDTLHSDLTKTIKDAHPPRFDYEWKESKTLVMTYKSARGLIDFAVGLIKGVGKYYNENLIVSKIDDSHIKIIFPK
jgi:hypothetical protein